MIGHVAPEAVLGGPIALVAGRRRDRHRRRPPRPGPQRARRDVLAARRARWTAAGAALQERRHGQVRGQVSSASLRRGHDGRSPGRAAEVRLEIARRPGRRRHWWPSGRPAGPPGTCRARSGLRQTAGWRQTPAPRSWKRRRSAGSASARSFDSERARSDGTPGTGRSSFAL